MVAAPIRLQVPGTLAYRDVAVRVVAEACRLVGHGDAARRDRRRDRAYDLSRPFDAAFVSAFAEIFNNIAIHAYRRRPPPAPSSSRSSTDRAETGDALMVEIRDAARRSTSRRCPCRPSTRCPRAAWASTSPGPCSTRSSYEPGPPNRWRLRKALAPRRKRPPASEFFDRTSTSSDSPSPS
jgi:serine/threonine-protein kinase RsbW